MLLFWQMERYWMVVELVAEALQLEYVIKQEKGYDTYHCIIAFFNSPFLIIIK